MTITYVLRCGVLLLQLKVRQARMFVADVIRHFLSDLDERLTLSRELLIAQDAAKHEGVCI